MVYGCGFTQVKSKTENNFPLCINSEGEEHLWTICCWNMMFMFAHSITSLHKNFEIVTNFSRGGKQHLWNFSILRHCWDTSTQSHTGAFIVFITVEDHFYCWVSCIKVHFLRLSFLFLTSTLKLAPIKRWVEWVSLSLLLLLILKLPLSLPHLITAMLFCEVSLFIHREAKC